MAEVTGLFLNLGIIVTIAALAAFILRLFKQPQILAYVIAGVIIGPLFRFITQKSVIDPVIVESTSLIGIAFLLFIVGLEMDLKSLKSVTLVSTLGGLIQIVSVFVLGFLISLILGFYYVEAAYLGLILAFSSTMVVVKILSDRDELHTLHGRIILGILLMQDIVAIFMDSFLSSLREFNSAILTLSIVKFLAMFTLAYLTGKFIFPKIFKFAAKNQELLLISSLAVCFSFSLAFQYLGFSIAIGAFIAGITLGNLYYSLEIASKVKSLKDFFSLLFFVSLGMGLSLGVLKKLWFPTLIFLLAVIILKPVIIMVICSLFKYSKKPSFLTANALGQVGEFSVILAAQGLALGHISQEILSITVVITLISITLTSYYIQFSDWFYLILKKPLKLFDVFTTEGMEYLPKKKHARIILCGRNRIGYSILKNFKRSKDEILIVDFNPEIISKTIKEGYHCIYGDITDDEIIERMCLPEVELLISTVPDYKDNALLIRKIKSCNHQAKIIATSNNTDDALKLYEHGADYVVLPHYLGGEHISNLITKFRKNKEILKQEKKGQIINLKQRKTEKHNGAIV